MQWFLQLQLGPGSKLKEPIRWCCRRRLGPNFLRESRPGKRKLQNAITTPRQSNINVTLRPGGSQGDLGLPRNKLGSNIVFTSRPRGQWIHSFCYSLRSKSSALYSHVQGKVHFDFATTVAESIKWLSLRFAQIDESFCMRYAIRKRYLRHVLYRAYLLAFQFYAARSINYLR